MPDEQDDLEVTEEQYRILRELGIADSEFEDMSMDEAQSLIDELRAERDAGLRGNA